MTLIEIDILETVVAKTANFILGLVSAFLVYPTALIAESSEPTAQSSFAEVADQNDLWSFMHYFKEEVRIGQTTLCEEKGAVGFDWVGGTWEKANFKKSRYAIKKLNHLAGPTRDDEKFCFMLLRGEKDFVFSTSHSFLSRCYRVSELGAERSDVVMCNEFYADGELAYISCDHDLLRFRPNGLFISRPSVASMNVEKRPQDEYKDSAVVAHGVCAPI